MRGMNQYNIAHGSTLHEVFRADEPYKMSPLLNTIKECFAIRAY